MGPVDPSVNGFLDNPGRQRLSSRISPISPHDLRSAESPVPAPKRGLVEDDTSDTRVPNPVGDAMNKEDGEPYVGKPSRNPE